MTKVSSLYIESGNGDDDRRQSHDNHHHHLHRQHQSGHHQNQNPASNKLKDNRYNSFKTWSGKLERQFTRKPASVEPDAPNRNNQNLNTNEAMPVDRYYDALEGPELETLRVRTYVFFYLLHLNCIHVVNCFNDFFCENISLLEVTRFITLFY